MSVFKKSVKNLCKIIVFVRFSIIICRPISWNYTCFLFFLFRLRVDKGECFSGINDALVRTRHCFLSYLNDGIKGSICPNTKVSARHIVTNGSRQHTQRDAKLLIVVASLIELQQTLKRLR